MRRVVITLAVVVSLLVVGAIYYALDPAQSPVFPRCVFLTATGFKCPGCGSQRALHALLHGDVAGAVRMNALMVVSVPWVALCVFAERQRTHNPRLYARLNAPALIWIFLAMVLLWWLTRNIFDW